MSEITENQIHFALGEKGVKKARKKRTGGDANLKGTDFEDEYTIWKILEYVAVALHEKDMGLNIRIKAQPLGFVDDLVVVRPGFKTVYSELKSSEEQRCTRKLRSNFGRQISVVRRNALPVELHLVLTPLVIGRTSVKNLPTEMKLISFEPSRPRDIRLLNSCAKGIRDGWSLKTLHALLRSVWYDIGRSGTLFQIVEKWRELANAEVLSTYPYGMSDEFIEFAEAHPDVLFVWDRDYVRYSFNGMEGLLLFAVGSDKWSAFEFELTHAPPADAMEFWRLLEKHSHDEN